MNKGTIPSKYMNEKRILSKHMNEGRILCCTKRLVAACRKIDSACRKWGKWRENSEEIELKCTSNLEML